LNIMSAYGIAINTDDDLALSSLASNDPLPQTRSLFSANDAGFAKGLPKRLCVHGDKDKQVDYQKNPVALTYLLKEHDVDCTLETFHGKGHELHTMGHQVGKVISDFFEASLV